MKPIDGEWLAGELFKCHVHDDEDLEPLVYLSDALNLIATAPTIDAIPVEWLKAQGKRGSIIWVIADILNERWQKEQEAR